MKSKYTFTLVLVVVAIGLFGASSLFAQEKMKYEDYLIELQQWQEREAAAQKQIDQLQAEIDDLKKRIADTEDQISETKSEMWRLMQVDEQGFRRHIGQMNRLQDQINGLLNLDSGELYKRKGELAGIEERLAELKGMNASKHPDAKDIIRDLERLMARLRNAVENAAPPYDMYTVVRGDYLYRIAGKQEIYNDPYQWLKIWSKNRELIKDPDVIYPNWELKIPRGLADDEHLVIKGETLSKIAGPFNWMKLYEANKSIIKDPNVIYPHMILIKH